jgi:hypothetical protein
MTLPPAPPEDIIDEVETAIYGVLKADTTLATLATWGGPGFAHNTEYPFIVLNLEETEVENLVGRIGWYRFRHRITVYTLQGGEFGPDRPSANAALAQIITDLNRVSLTINGYTHIASIIERPYAAALLLIGGDICAGVSADLVTWVQ